MNHSVSLIAAVAIVAGCHTTNETPRSADGVGANPGTLKESTMPEQTINHINYAIPAATNPQVVEIAAYSVREDQFKQFDGVHQRLMDAILPMPGFVRAIALRGGEDDLHIVDYVVWESRDDATRAAKDLQSDDVYPAIMALIERMHYFGHSRVLDRLAPGAAEGDVYEFAAFTIKAGETHSFLAKQPALFEAVANQPGFLESQKSQDIDMPDRFIDLLRWESMEAATAATEALHEMVVCQSAMSHVDRDDLFLHLRFYRETR
ncbi:MAG: antibiotic biosynthesis monooxygenase [Planctomycetota bacterium]|nr:antibiotic biosynthesis monooxygenase [Planctomycetota bacterium]